MRPGDAVMFVPPAEAGPLTGFPEFPGTLLELQGPDAVVGTDVRLNGLSEPQETLVFTVPAQNVWAA
jgi:hypothetical protein